MNFDNQVAGMTPGQALMDVPIPKLIENTAKAIAAAQYELDSTSVRAATMLSETRISFNDADGTSRERSLLELGFIPQFYHFKETEMEFKVTISVRVESGIDFGVEAGLGSTESAGLPVAFAGTISFDLHHKYEFDMEAVSRIKTTMKSIPPPQAFLDAIRNHAASGGGTISAPDGPAVTPEPVDPVDPVPADPDPAPADPVDPVDPG
ncbi:hypothetical protein EH243_00015 [Amphritea opalescens]|uniref:DUF2589 domain-containing protein n=1 Tax=Amphritea opalescens TaxID=2490544 RepID=A0A430KV85_9GAMM|nr:hypothetical protein [Amphritea opalescens]RTE67376.1 hypothetical protein EH243_00015 [Amphritea opalescens]